MHGTQAAMAARVTRRIGISTEYRRRLAELTILERYDLLRSIRYGDYGGGQRAGEVNRRARELDELKARLERELGAVLEDRPPTRDELERAFGRVAAPKCRRLLATIERQGRWTDGRGTRPTRVSLDCWRLVIAELELHIDTPTR